MFFLQALPVLVCPDWYQLDTVGIISTASSGTQLFEKGWAVSFPGVAQGLGRRTGIGIPTSPWLSAAALESFPEVERDRFAAAGSETLSVVCAYAPNSS